MALRERFFNRTIAWLFRCFCHIEVQGLQSLPLTGPAIIITNHTSNWEGPLLYVSIRPRVTIAMAKAELWKFFMTRMIMQAWKAIPLHRGRLDRRAMARAWQVLDDGHFLCLAPEGRRSPDGCLLRAQPGATYFASERQVVIYPIVQWGCHDLVKTLLKGQRPHIVLKAGRPFTVKKPADGKWTASQRQAMADEMMYQMAQLLPAQYRGYYNDLSAMTSQYLSF